MEESGKANGVSGRKRCSRPSSTPAAKKRLLSGRYENASILSEGKSSDSANVPNEHSQPPEDGSDIRANGSSDEDGNSFNDRNQESFSKKSDKKKRCPMKARSPFGVRLSPSPRRNDDPLEVIVITGESELKSSKIHTLLNEQLLSDVKSMQDQSDIWLNGQDDEADGSGVNDQASSTSSSDSSSSKDAARGSSEKSISRDEMISLLQSTIAQLSSMVTKLNKEPERPRSVVPADIKELKSPVSNPSADVNDQVPVVNNTADPPPPESRSCSASTSDTSSSKDMNPNYSPIERKLIKGLKKKITMYISKCAISGPPGTGKSHLHALLLGRPRPSVRRCTPLSSTADEVIPNAHKIADSCELFVDGEKQGAFKWFQIDKATWAKLLANTIAISEASEKNSDELNSHEKHLTLPKDHLCSMILTQLKKMPKNLHRRNSLNRKKLVYLVDTGGQPQFQEILPNFVRASISILVHKLSEKLTDFPKFTYFIDKTKFNIDDDKSICNLSIIEQSVRSVCSMKQSTGKSIKTMPSIAIVGTFKDHFEKQCNEAGLEADKELQLRNEQILSKVEPFMSEYNLCEILKYGRNKQITFPINGSEDGWEKNDSVIDLLKHFIIENQEIKLTIPLWNFVFLQMMKDEAQKREKKIFTISQCTEIAQKCVLSPSEEDIQSALCEFHEVNVLLYFPESLENLVFIDPSFLYQIVTEVIEKSFHCSDLDIQNREFNKTGVMTKSFLEHIPSFRNLSGDFTQENFLQLLQDLLIIANLGNFTYFMPCVLPLEIPDALSQDCQKELESISGIMKDNNIDGPLVISFGDGITPRGLFCSIVVELNKRYGWKLSERKNYIRRRNIVEFSVYWSAGVSSNQANTLFKSIDKTLMGSALIFDKFSYLEVHTTCSRECCCLIYRAIMNCLDIACEKMEYLSDSLGIRVGLYCNTGACKIVKEHHSQCSFREDRGKWFENCKHLGKALPLSENRSVWFSDPSQDKITKSKFPHKEIKNIKDVLNVTIEISHKWMKFAILLLGDGGYVNRIEADYTRTDERFIQVILSWKRQIYPPFSWTTLVNVLREPAIAEFELAEKIQKNFIEA